MYKFLLWLGLIGLGRAGSMQTDFSSSKYRTQPSSYAPCTTDSGMPGECVNFYLCDSNKNMIQDGKNVFAKRFQTALTDRISDCTSPMENCCLRPDIRDSRDPLVPPHEDIVHKREGCGRRNPNGVGNATEGENDKYTKFGEFPWVVAILKIQLANADEPDGVQEYMYSGSGSLIHRGVVLTAAHILAGNHSLVVRAGDWDTRTNQEPYQHQQSDVANTVVHNKFNDGNLHYDIALLFLREPLELAPNVGLVCLPPPHQRVPSGTRCTVSGWGKDKFSKAGHYRTLLKKVEVPVVEHQKCEEALRRTRLGYYFQLDSSFMCAGGETGADTCEGDGGAPLVCPIEAESDRFTQSGIVAWGIGCGDTGIPGVYVDVASLRTWIDEQIILKKLNPEVYTYNNKATEMSSMKPRSSSKPKQPINFTPHFKPNNVHTSNNNPDNYRTSYNNPDDARSGYNNPDNYRTSYNNPDDARPGYNNPDNYHISYNNPDDARSGYNNPDNYRTSYNNPDDARPGYNNPDNYHTSYNNPDEARLGYNKPDHYRTSYNNPDDARPGYNNPDNYHTSYNNPDEARLGYNKPDHYRTSYNNPDDARPGYNNPDNYHTSYNNPDEARLGYNKPDHYRTSYNNPDDARPGYNNPDNYHISYNNPDDARSGYNNPDNYRTSYNNPDDARPGYNNPDNYHTSYNNPDEARLGYNKPDHYRTSYNNPDDAREHDNKVINTSHSFDY